MYLEITPMTFSVNVKAGVFLSQLRLFYGAPKVAEVSGRELCGSLLLVPAGANQPNGSLSVDLKPTTQSGEVVSAFCACHDESSSDPTGPIDLWIQSDRTLADPCRNWTFKRNEESALRLQITKNEFYILRSKARIALPPGIAVYCRANDE